METVYTSETSVATVFIGVIIQITDIYTITFVRKVDIFQ
jgi:hypothetical protein